MVLWCQMKIKPEHYQVMLDAIRPLAPTIKQRRDKSESRLCWDLLHEANLTPFLCDTVYDYANDDHIETALKKIVKELANESAR